MTDPSKYYKKEDEDLEEEEEIEEVENEEGGDEEEESEDKKEEMVSKYTPNQPNYQSQISSIYIPTSKINTSQNEFNQILIPNQNISSRIIINNNRAEGNNITNNINNLDNFNNIISLMINMREHSRRQTSKDQSQPIKTNKQVQKIITNTQQNTNIRNTNTEFLPIDNNNFNLLDINREINMGKSKEENNTEISENLSYSQLLE